MLTQARVTISVINPRQSHHFAQMQLSITKTDSRDAVILAEYGRVMQPTVYQFSKEILLALRQKRALLQQYQKQRVMLTNLQESFSPLPYQDATTQLSLVSMVGHFEKAIAQIKGEINKLCKEDFEEQLRRLTSIKGISDTIATTLIETTNGFQDFHSAKALAKYIGLAPVTYQSGKASQSRGINRTGDPHLRGMGSSAVSYKIRHLPSIVSMSQTEERFLKIKSTSLKIEEVYSCKWSFTGIHLFYIPAKAHSIPLSIVRNDIKRTVDCLIMPRTWFTVPDESA